MFKFDYKFYISYYSDIRENNINTYEKAFEHWNRFGINENRFFNQEVCDDNFDWIFYTTYY